jgi:multidrug transporter EmrE-like cation transporter
MKYGYLITITFILNAQYSIANKIMATRPKEVALYMVIMYIAATLGALFIVRHQKSRFEKRGAIIGVIAGCCVILTTVTMIAAAATLPGFVVFPVFSGLSLLLVALMGRIVFKEHIGPYGYLGIACGIAAIILLSIP